MSGSIKLRTKLRGDTLQVRLLIRHEMEVGGRTAEGRRIKPHFIKRVECLVNDELKVQGHWGGGIAKNPYLSFELPNVKAGDELLVHWEDNLGERDEFRTVVAGA